MSKNGGIYMNGFNQKEYIKDWKKENYKQFKVELKKEEKENLDNELKKNNLSGSEFVRNVLSH